MTAPLALVLLGRSERAADTDAVVVQVFDRPDPSSTRKAVACSLGDRRLTRFVVLDILVSDLHDRQPPVLGSAVEEPGGVVRSTR
jgi:hypothetical protein